VLSRSRRISPPLSSIHHVQRLIRLVRVRLSSLSRRLCSVFFIAGRYRRLSTKGSSPKKQGEIEIVTVIESLPKAILYLITFPFRHLSSARLFESSPPPFQDQGLGVAELLRLFGRLRTVVSSTRGEPDFSHRSLPSCVTEASPKFTFLISLEGSWFFRPCPQMPHSPGVFIPPLHCRIARSSPPYLRSLPVPLFPHCIPPLGCRYPVPVLLCGRTFSSSKLLTK